MDYNIGDDAVIRYNAEDRLDTLRELYKTAIKNYKEKNLPLIQKTSQKVMPAITGKDIIVVGSGPSTRKQFRWLYKLSHLKDKKTDQYYFTLIVLDSAYKYLRNNNVRMDYIFTSEVGDHTYFDGPYDGRSILLAYAGSGSAYQWKGPVYFHDYIYESEFKMNKCNQLPCYPTGFIVLNSVLGMCNLYGTRSVILIGNDLCFKSKAGFYAFQWNNEDKTNSKYSDDQIIKIPGEWNLYTTKGFALAAAWMVNWYRQKAFNYQFVNCSRPCIVEGLNSSTLKEIYMYMANTTPIEKFYRFLFEVRIWVKQLFLVRWLFGIFQFPKLFYAMLKKKLRKNK
jgi:hypothetical protein